MRVSGEELLANWFGWTNRTLEATAKPEDVPWAWRQYAYRGYLLLQGLDRRLLESRLPAAIFYNLMIAARKPASVTSADGRPPGPLLATNSASLRNTGGWPGELSAKRTLPFSSRRWY